MKSELSVLSELQFYKKFQVHSKAASYIGKLPNSCVNVSTGLWSSVKPSWEALGQLLSRKRKSRPCAFQEMEALLASQGSSSSRTLADRTVEAKRPSQGPWRQKEVGNEDALEDSTQTATNPKQAASPGNLKPPWHLQPAPESLAWGHFCTCVLVLITYKQTALPNWDLSSCYKLKMDPVPSLLGVCWDKSYSGYPV